MLQKIRFWGEPDQRPETERRHLPSFPKTSKYLLVLMGTRKGDILDKCQYISATISCSDLKPWHCYDTMTVSYLLLQKTIL
jgi:hypothetical protein